MAVPVCTMAVPVCSEIEPPPVANEWQFPLESTSV
jgi:hypothetical protein